MQNHLNLAKRVCLLVAVFFVVSVPLKYLLRKYIYVLFEIPPDSDIGIGGIHFFFCIGCVSLGFW